MPILALRPTWQGLARAASCLAMLLLPGSAAGQEAGKDGPRPRESPAAPRYSSVGKRDPFQPLSLKPRVSARARENLSPLERYEIGQLKLVAVVWDIKEPTAMVEDATGLGYIVKIGTLVGPNEGKVKAIKPGEVVIEESFVDFYGAKKSQEISMKLPVEQ